MSAQHTASHWINDGAEISACVDPAHPSYIAPICSLDTDWHPDIVAANARLIAAAPELLAFVERVANLPEFAHYLTLIDAARELVAKAGTAPAREVTT
jgi:hypothetical protein